MQTETYYLQQQRVTFPVMEAFYTIQGEGFHQGRAAYFIRLGGCDVGCVWCDVKESWDASKHPLMSVSDIIGEASKYPGRLAVVTGGEPLMHNCEPLTTALCMKQALSQTLKRQEAIRYQEAGTGFAFRQKSSKRLCRKFFRRQMS